VTEPPTRAEQTDALLLARDPFLLPAEAPRLRQLRYLQSDDAVTAADLQFTLGLYRRLANNLDIVRKQGARALLDAQDEASRRRCRGVFARLESSPWVVWPVGLLTLVWVVVGVAIVVKAG